MGWQPTLGASGIVGGGWCCGGGLCGGGRAAVEQTALGCAVGVGGMRWCGRDGAGGRGSQG